MRSCSSKLTSRRALRSRVCRLLPLPASETGVATSARSWSNPGWSRRVFATAFSRSSVTSSTLKIHWLTISSRPILRRAFSNVLPVTRLPDWAIHSLSITMACCVVLLGYSDSIKLISDSGISRHLPSGIQSRPSRLQMSDNRKSA